MMPRSLRCQDGVAVGSATSTTTAVGFPPGSGAATAVTGSPAGTWSTAAAAIQEPLASCSHSPEASCRAIGFTASRQSKFLAPSAYAAVRASHVIAHAIVTTIGTTVRFSHSVGQAVGEASASPQVIRTG